MAYAFDNYDDALVISGWENGVGDSPHDGISDMRNVNIISVPGEVSVNFATAVISSPTISGAKTITGVSGNAITFAAVTGLEAGMAIKFISVSNLTGVSLNTTYWVNVATGFPSTTAVTLYSDYAMATPVTITGTGGDTFTVFNVASPKYFTQDADDTAVGGLTTATFMQDASGQVWSNIKVTGVNSYWTFIGLSGTSDTGACGLAYYKASDGTRWVFAFNSTSIDYFTLSSLTWTWGWNPATGTTSQSSYLNSAGNHEALVAPDSKFYFCDGNWVSEFFQLDPGTPFVPTTPSTYTYAQNKALLPITDKAISLGYIGSNILIGGQNNIVYSWDGTSTGTSTWIILPEYTVHRMITVNTNTFLFVGNRGRIYVTNGTNAQLYKKVPDHISGTVEPYFQWGGACTVKNQLYFSLICTTNAGGTNSQYGGVWAIDMDTEAIRLTNQLSYGTYAGYAPAIIPIFGTTGHNPGGTGLFTAWDNGSLSFGIDTTVSTPYTSSQASIDTDLIPIGTFNKTRDVTQIEYKLTTPLVSGESITIYTRLIFNTRDTGYTQTLTDSTVGAYSGTSPINFQQAQWAQFQIVLNSTASSPSYARLKQIRILGFTGPTLSANQMLSI